MKNQNGWGWTFVVAGLTLWIVTIYASLPGEGTRAFGGTEFEVPSTTSGAHLGANEIKVNRQDIRSDEGTVVRKSIRLENVSLRASRSYVLETDEGEQRDLSLVVLPRWTALVTFLGTLLLFAGLPLVIPIDGKDEHGKATPINHWYALLSEPYGGLSLGRVQFLLWFAPAAALYAAMSLPALRFAPITTTLAVLLGLGGATTALGAAANPKDPDAAKSDADAQAGNGPAEIEGAATASKQRIPPADLKDLVTDWQGHADLSRYQYLLLNLIGSVTMTVAFLKHLDSPMIPEQFLYLVGASQATYLTTKAIKS